MWYFAACFLVALFIVVPMTQRTALRYYNIFEDAVAVELITPEKSNG